MPATSFPLGVRSLSTRLNCSFVGSKKPTITRSSSAPFAHLYAPSQQISSIRAFSTTMLFAIPEKKDDGLNLDLMHDSADVTLSDRVEGNDSLQALGLDDSTNTPLVQSLKYVRGRFKMAGAEYNEYWRLVIEAQCANEDDKASADKRAESLLAEIQINYTADSTRQAVRLRHKPLMEFMQRVASRFARIQKARYTSDLRRGTVMGLLAELKTPASHPRLIREIEHEIESLENYIATSALKQSNNALISSTLNQASNKETVCEQPEEYSVEQLKEAAFYRQQEIDKLKETLKSYKRSVAAIKDVVAEQKKNLQFVWKKKRDIHAKRQNLLKQLTELEKESQRAKMVATSQTVARTRNDLDNILERALAKTTAGADHSMLVRDSPMQRLEFFGAKIMDVATPARKENATKPLFTMKKEPGIKVDEPEESSSGVATRLQSPLASKTTMLTDAASQPSNSSQIPNKTQSLAPNARLSDALYLKVPASNTFYIDDNLTIDLSAPIRSLQTQVFEMQERLRSSYPRIDDLPYEVWTSNNIRTLQTWLKIMISRWKTRFDDIGQSMIEAKGVNKGIRAVLDHMVRDHDLSNEAAKRMAILWNNVVLQREAINRDAGGLLDWDEFDAGGLGFLKEAEEAEMNMDTPKDPNETAMLNRMLMFKTKSMHRGFEGLLRRQYSTSASLSCGTAAISTGSKTLDSETTSVPIGQSQSIAPYGTQLPHLTSAGTAHMVSVSNKSFTCRTAIAVGTVCFSNPTPISLIRSASLKKGDVLSVSRIAGIMAAKKCPEIVPLCHPISLSHVSVELTVLDSELETSPRSHNIVDMNFGGIEIEAKVQCTGPTGVEMEALTAVMGAALSVVDMCKAVDKSQRIQDVRVVRKEGGRSGIWVEEGWEKSGPV